MSVEISIDQKSVNETMKRINDMPKIADDWIEKLNAKTGITAQTYAKQKLKADKHIVLARLWNSINWFTKKQNTNFRYRDEQGNSFSGKLKEKAKKNELILGTNVFYAKDIEQGRPARVIRPVKKKALAFFPKGTRKLVIVKKIKQKALSADPFIEYAMKKVLPKWKKEFNNMADDITK